MPVEYDLVVIGGSSAGVYAAVAAARLKARVALVEQRPGETGSLEHTLMEVGRVAHQMRASAQFGVYPPEASLGVSVRCDRAMQWAEAVVSTLAERNSRANLESLGVEVIFGAGQFCQPLSFTVNGRQLRARAYLIATGIHSQPNIPGLETIGYLTREDIFRLNSPRRSQWPQEVLVIGGELSGTQLSQTLTRLGSQVTLIAEGPHILAQEDPEAAGLIQAQLEAEGVRILTHSRVTQAKEIDGKKWVLAGAQAIETSEILLTVGQRPPEELNLAAVGVKVGPQGIEVNNKLQTSHPQIYACGDVIGGYQLAHVANYEAGVALKNALFWPIFQVNYRAVPWAVLTDPELARVGLTEVEASQRFSRVRVLKQFYKTLDRAQMRGETTGFCKLIVQGNGTVLGAHLVGPAAGEVVHLIALAMRQGLKVRALAELVHISPTFSEISSKTARGWQESSQYSARANFLESFFNLRRSWSE